jgi:hypothetical protein
MRTSFRHQSEAQPPNGPLTAAASPDTPSHMSHVLLAEIRATTLHPSLSDCARSRRGATPPALRGLNLDIASLIRAARPVITINPSLDKWQK